MRQLVATCNTSTVILRAPLMVQLSAAHCNAVGHATTRLRRTLIIHAIQMPRLQLVTL